MHFALSDYLMDAVHNAIEAGSRNINLRLEEDSTGGEVILEIEDDGSGMDDQTLARVLDPFYTDGIKHAHRKVGLGLPFLKQMLDSIAGSFLLESEPGRGTVLRCRYPSGHLDSPPQGDIAGALSALISYPGEFELSIFRRRGEASYRIQRSELIDALGELDTAGSLELLSRFMESQEEFHGETDS